MSVFKDITFEFKGEAYTVEASNVYRLLAELYEVIHPADLMTDKPNLVKLANAFATCIRYCGGNPSDEDVYEAMFNADSPINATHVVSALMLLLVPPKEYQTTSGNDSKKKNQETQ